MFTKLNLLLPPARRILSSNGLHISKAIPATAQQKLVKQDQQQFLPGNSYSGFHCKRVQFIADFNMTAMIFEHEKTGLQYVHIDRNDSNNLFSINFRTTPFNSSGLPHILEHSVLCGSQKFPVRDPFFKMLNRSLATFMNAMTGPDYTFYPFSSTNEKDYRNLQDIYMDACFRPNLKYLDFLQEGWRLEHKELENKSSEYIFKGVVYNEMKGAFSENGAIFGQKMFNSLLPEHTYGFVSGGDPLDIPSLTHEDLVNFHRKYYHPSNARIFSYGNFQLEKNLDYVNRYLADYERIDSRYSEVPNQNRWTSSKKMDITARYDSMGAQVEKQNQIGFGYLMNDIREIDETFVCYFLNELLVKGPNSYFYKSLIEPNISGGYNQMTGYDNSIKDAIFVLGLQDVHKDDFGKIEEIVDATVDKAIEQGFEEKHIQTVIHNLELSMKHQSTKFGLGLLFNLTPLMNHDGDVIHACDVTKQIETLKANIRSNPHYLQEKVKQYFKDNRHKLTLTMSPDEDYERKFTEDEAKNLSEKIANLKATDKARVFEDGKKLAEAQKSHEDINILPCLKIEDIKTPTENELKFLKLGQLPLQLCPTNTNGVVYFRGLLNASNLVEDELKLLPLFAQIVDQFGTKKHDYREFDTLVSSKTAGLSFKVHLTEQIQDNKLYEVGIEFGSYALRENSQQMFNILTDLFTTVEFNDIARFEMLLENYVSTLSVGIAQSGHLYAMQNANGLVTEAARLKESISGIEHLNFIKKLMKEKNSTEILEILKGMAKKLLLQAPMRCALNVAANDADQEIRNVEKFVSSLPSVGQSDLHWNKSNLLSSSCRHNVMNIPVNYCGKSVHTVPYIHDDYSSLKVLGRILSSKYLLPVVREQNGAYGAGARVSIDGLFNFFSYRDPNTTKTFDTFDASAAWVQSNMKTIIDDQALFEAKLGILQQLDAPQSPAEIGLENFKHGITHKIFAKHRDCILSTSRADIERVSEKYLADDSRTVVGKSCIGPVNEELIRAKNEKWTVNEQNE